MKLTPHQRTRLITYWKLHRTPPTRADLFKRVARQFAIFAMLCIVSGAGTFAADPFISRLAMVTFGVFVGMTISAISVVNMTFRIWPMVEKITDWERVDALKREYAPDAA